MSVVFFFALAAGDAAAQKRFSKKYPASRDVKLHLLNLAGTVTVEGWNRSEVSVSAYLESPSATVNPYIKDNILYINLVKDNQNRNVGEVNFTIRVPYDARVDIETKIGNLNVSNIRGSLVRAHISSDGDILLQNISAALVAAETGIGDVFFDGQIQEKGVYQFSTMQGSINLRIPFNSSFKLIATAPSTRSINLGNFAGNGMRQVGDGRRIVGVVGNGSSSVNVTNIRGTIRFISR